MKTLFVIIVLFTLSSLIFGVATTCNALSDFFLWIANFVS